MPSKFSIILAGEDKGASKLLGDVGKAGDNLDGKTSGWSSRWSSAFGNMGGILARFSSDGSGHAGGLLGSLNGLNSGGTAALGALAGAAGIAGLAFAGVMADMTSKAFDALQQIGGYLYDLGDQYNEAFKTIRRGSGDNVALNADLKESYKDVYEQTAASSGDVATAVTLLHQKLGMTGDGLEGLALTMLRFGTVTGTDLRSNLETIPRIFNQWDVAAGDQTATMDKLMRAWQQTGVPVQQLEDGLVKFAAPLSELGYGMDESIAILAQFQQQGVNVDEALRAMGLTLKTTAKDANKVGDNQEKVTAAQESYNKAIEKHGAGSAEAEKAHRKLISAQEDLAKSSKAVDPGEVFASAVDRIKNAGSDAEANQIAVGLFGKSAIEMGKAIRSGDFDYQALMGTITNGSDTVEKASKGSTDWRKSLEKFTHFLSNKLQPISEKVFGAVDGVMSTAVTMATALVNAFDQGGFDGLVDALGIEWDLVKMKLEELWDNLFQWWETHDEEVYEWIGKALGNIGELGGKILDGLGEWLPKIGDWIMNVGVPWLEDHWGEWWKTATDWFGKMAPIVIEKLGGLLAELTGWFVGTALPWAFKTGWDWLSSLFKWLLTDGIPTMLLALGNLLGAIVEWVETDGISALADAGRALWGGLAEGAKGAFNAIAEMWNQLDPSVGPYTIPDWVPIYGGNTFEIGDILPDMPTFSYLGGGAMGSSQYSSGGVKRMATGGEFVARTPQLFMAGDLGQHERVTVRPVGNDGGSIDGAGRPLQVNLMVDGKVMAQGVYPHIVVMERSRGVRR